jgi:outer membrane protein
MRKLIFIAVCAAMVLAGCKGGGKSSATAGADSLAMPRVSDQIAYINMDSLVAGYDMYHELRAQFEEKAKKVDNVLSSKGRSFENAVADFQNKVQKGLVTTATAQSMQADLEKRQQSLMQQRDKSMAEIAEEEQVLLNQIHYSIVDFLEEFNSDGRYGMIMSTSAGGPILNADPQLDITAIVKAGLNEKYAAEKGKKKTEEQAGAAE